MRLTKLSLASLVVAVLSLAGGLGPQSCQAQGVSVTPLRVLFDGRTRSATVFLSNRSLKAGTYRISLVNRRMLADGDIVEADEPEPGEWFADDLISFSPRRVTVAPRSAQTIRLLVRRPRGKDFPEDVEFRTHLSVRSIPPTPRIEDLENNERLIEEQRLEVRPVVTVETVIPILIRFGNPRAEVAITHPRLDLEDAEAGCPVLQVDLERTGERSVYGDLEVIHTAPDGTERSIFLNRALAVYYPTPVRTKSMRLTDVPPALLRSGSLLVRYVEIEEMHGDAEAELTIPLGPGGLQVP